MFFKWVGTALLAFFGVAHAQDYPKAMTFSVEADSDYPFCCVVSKDVVFVYNAYNDLFERGMAEFDLQGARSDYAGTPVFLTFNYDSFFSTFSPSHYLGAVSIVAYVGDNIAARPDYSVASFATVGSFTPGDLALGSSLAFDVTSIYQYALRAGDPALGFRLQGLGGSFSGQQGANFSNFALVTAPVPEPSSAALMLVGLAFAGLVIRSKARTSSAAPA